MSALKLKQSTLRDNVVSFLLAAWEDTHIVELPTRVPPPELKAYLRSLTRYTLLSPRFAEACPVSDLFECCSFVELEEHMQAVFDSAWTTFSTKHITATSSKHNRN